MKCIICKSKIKKESNGWDGGHNAEPVIKGRCCIICNDAIVIPMRLAECNLIPRRIKKNPN